MGVIQSRKNGISLLKRGKGEFSSSVRGEKAYIIATVLRGIQDYGTRLCN